MFHRLKKSHLPIAALMSFSLYSQSAIASSRDGWHFMLTPYGWASSINADLRVKGRSADMNLTFIDILKHLDFAAQGHLEAGYGPWSLMIDPTYLKVNDNSQRRSIGLSIRSQTSLIDGGIFYRLFSKSFTPLTFISLELLGGARHLGLKNSLTFNQALTVSDSTDMTAPIIGARIKTDLTAKLGFWVRGDIGGFHVDHVKQTWSTTLGMSYALQSHIDLGLAYRILKIDYSRSSSGMNLLLYGPMIGFSFHY
jgi:hypothetical protein